MQIVVPMVVLEIVFDFFGAASIFLGESMPEKKLMIIDTLIQPLCTFTCFTLFGNFSMKSDGEWNFHTHFNQELTRSFAVLTHL